VKKNIGKSLRWGDSWSKGPGMHFGNALISGSYLTWSHGFNLTPKVDCIVATMQKQMCLSKKMYLWKRNVPVHLIKTIIW
jgi:hypothetical protein